MNIGSAKQGNNKKMTLAFLGLGLVLLAGTAMAASGASSVGAMASTITKSFSKLAALITAGAYVAGLGFAIGAIMKFKAHKDNPTQITVGTPIALIFIAAALLFLPSILKLTGGTVGLTSVGSTKGVTKF